MSFHISTQPIEPAPLLAQVPQTCGAIVTFEGRVRNHHEGKEVTALEYSAHPVLAEKEGLAVLVEAPVSYTHLTLPTKA